MYEMYVLDCVRQVFIYTHINTLHNNILHCQYAHLTGITCTKEFRQNSVKIQKEVIFLWLRAINFPHYKTYKEFFNENHNFFSKIF